MSNELERINASKLWVLQRFYGIEEHLDTVSPLPAMLSSLDDIKSAFSWMTKLKELDIWFIRVNDRDNVEVWSPFVEPLYEFEYRYRFLVAHMYPDKQWSDKDIIRHAGGSIVLC